MAWLLAFLLAPTLLVFAFAFRRATPYGDIGDGWTLDTIIHLASPNYPAVVWRTIYLSAAATCLCLALAVPVGYCLARLAPRWRQLAILAVTAPFWINFLIRVFAWKSILAIGRPLHSLLARLGAIEPNQPLLYTGWAVLLVMIYTHLPFAILPIYAAAEKFDFNLLEAARDLGSSAAGAFRRVFLPGISRGLLTAGIMVAVPCLGSYVIPDLVGGTRSEMLGNKIAQYVYLERNLPRASALSAILTLTVVALLLGFLRWSDNRLRQRLDAAPARADREGGRP
ncbi:MAG: ABC transporter permease [Planctomycetota bacterium]|nr:ABC transporter permease [Planctomycetota bacterium]